MSLSGAIVMGSTIMPLSLRFTRSTSSACRSMGMLRWMIPMPPCCASAMARCDSVTVSIAALTMGILQSDVARQECARIGLRGKNFAASGDKQDVVEGEPFRNRLWDHAVNFMIAGSTRKRLPKHSRTTDRDPRAANVSSWFVWRCGLGACALTIRDSRAPCPDPVPPDPRVFRSMRVAGHRRSRTCLWDKPRPNPKPFSSFLIRPFRARASGPGPRTGRPADPESAAARACWVPCDR